MPAPTSQTVASWFLGMSKRVHKDQKDTVLKMKFTSIQRRVLPLVSLICIRPSQEVLPQNAALIASPTLTMWSL